jgi:hypothetical protein
MMMKAQCGMASMNPGVGAASRTRRPSTPSPGTPLSEFHAERRLVLVCAQA